jgi:pumilio RNA-binding family
LDELSKRDVADLISTFKGNVLLCLNDHNGTILIITLAVIRPGKYADNHILHHSSGNHVIQKSISILFSMAKEARENGEDDLCTLCLESIDPVVDEIISSVELLAKHSYGCRAVQRMVEYSIEPQRSKVLNSIIAVHDSLLCHTYGNYVVQKTLEHGRPSDRDAIFKSITVDNSVIKFSKQKQASNVVEAMLRLGDAFQRQQIVQEMINVSDSFACDEIMMFGHLSSNSFQCFCVDHHNATENAIMSMSKDPYANYVIKTALKVIEEGEQRDKLYSILLSRRAELVSPHSFHINIVSYRWHVISL